MDSDHSENRLRELFEDQEIYKRLEQYISLCTACPDCDEAAPTERNSQRNKQKTQNARTCFPNLAGFCRYLETSTEELEEQRASYPEAYGRIMAVLEDEALNSSLSPTLISAYLKRHVGYDGNSARSSGKDSQLRIRFEHDIFKDGE